MRKKACSAVPDDDDEAAALMRFKITAVEQYFSWLEDVQGKCFRAEAKLQEDVARFVGWRAAVRNVIVARARVEGLAPLIRAAETEVDQAENCFSNAQARLTEHLNHPILEPQYAAPAKIKKWNTATKSLEANLAAASRALGEKKNTLRRLRSDLLQANDALFARPGGLLFTAEMLQPREPQKERGVGSLGAVN